MLFLLLFFLAVLIAAEVYSIYKGMDKITYDAQVSQSLLEPNEEFTITTKIGHYKFWFLSYLEMVENFPTNCNSPTMRILWLTECTAIFPPNCV